MGIALGRRHRIIRELRRLRRERRLRDERGLILGEGVHVAIEALRREAQIEAAFVAPAELAKTDEGAQLLARLERQGVPVYELAAEVLQKLQDARHPQPILTLVRRRNWALAEVLAGPRPRVVLAWGVQDPGNLGALARTARAAGATGLVAIEPCADLFHPRTVRASAGALLDWPATHAAGAAVLSALGQDEWTRFAAHPHRGEPYDTVSGRPPLAVAFGGEGPGLPPALAAPSWRCVRIPLAADVESLPVVAAAAVILFALARGGCGG